MPISDNKHHELPLGSFLKENLDEHQRFSQICREKCFLVKADYDWPMNGEPGLQPRSFLSENVAQNPHFLFSHNFADVVTDLQTN